MRMEQWAKSGIAARRTLLSLDGWDHGRIERELRVGALVRVAHGWLARPDHDARVSAALSAGGRLTCLPALRLAGAWTPAHRSDHIRFRCGQSVPPAAKRARSHRLPRDVVVEDTALPYDALREAFMSAAKCVDRVGFVVVADSLLNRRLATREQLEDWAAAVSGKASRRLGACDARSQSGTETMLRLALAAVGIVAEPQFAIGDERVDLRIGDRLLVECDSAEFHTGVDAYENDRRRDLEFRRLGYEVLRFSRRQLMEDMDSVVALIRMYVARGDHRWRRDRPRARTR